MGNKTYSVVIAGAGGIGRAAGLLLRELGDFEVNISIGDAVEPAAKQAAEWIRQDSLRPGKVISFAMPKTGSNAEFDGLLAGADIVLDCLPGNQAPRIAALAKQFNLHYANLTEYVKETNQVMEIASGAEKGFILQTGLAPGFVNVLVNGLFQQFCRENKVEQVEAVSMKVGALTQNSYPPHYYGFTWSPVGVATLYVKPARVIRDFQPVARASLTERSEIIIEGIQFEEDLTSGGAADLPDALAGKTRRLDYKTLRYAGHYAWIDSVLREIPHGEDLVKRLQEKMEEHIPLVEEDLVVIYTSVLGRDRFSKLRLSEKSYLIKPVQIGKK
ncbi:MAG: saccharopine dehydrogenase NADP-binding domain-containing protein, partial [Calditrichia bacterium]